MTIKLPERRYFNFEELISRWRCEVADIRHLLIDGKLTASVFIDPEELGYVEAMWDWEHEDAYYCIYDDIEESHEHTRIHKGFYHLALPHQTTPFDCLFSYITDTLNWQTTPWEEPKGKWWRLVSWLTLDEVVKNGVVMFSEVSRFETKLAEPEQPANQEKSLHPKERKSLLTIIATLCTLNKIDLRTHAASATVIKNAAEQLDLKIGETTIENYLKEAQILLGQPQQIRK
ncbi:MAG: hypothetical protein EPO06_09840 [Burkholderiaceae bacterium]|nr:MAG: hypothetical protein EPO06_09840 [Burkholderiaceae bacterium]